MVVISGYVISGGGVGESKAKGRHRLEAVDIGFNVYLEDDTLFMLQHTLYRSTIPSADPEASEGTYRSDLHPRPYMPYDRERK